MKTSLLKVLLAALCATLPLLFIADALGVVPFCPAYLEGGLALFATAGVLLCVISDYTNRRQGHVIRIRRARTPLPPQVRRQVCAELVA